MSAWSKLLNSFFSLYVSSDDNLYFIDIIEKREKTIEELKEAKNKLDEELKKTNMSKTILESGLESHELGS